MEDIFVLERIDELCKQRGWSHYELSKRAGIAQSSISAMINKQHIPTMSTLIKICNGFGITLPQFFSAIDTPTDEQIKLLNLWNLLDARSKELTMAYMYGLAHKPIPAEGDTDKHELS